MSHWNHLDDTMFETDSVDYFQRIIANSGTINLTTKTAYDAWVKSAKAHSYYTKISRCNWFLGDQLAAALVPGKIGGGNSTDTNHNFVSGDYTLAGGLAGNTTTKYLQTGWIPSSHLSSSLDAHLGVIALAAGANNARRAYVGGIDGQGTPAAFLLRWENAGTIQQSRMGNSTNGSAGWVLASPAIGHIIRTNRSASTGNAMLDAVNNSGSAATTNTLSQVEAYVFNYNNNGTAADYGGHTLAGYHMGTGLTTTNVTDLYNDLIALHSAISRTAIP